MTNGEIARICALHGERVDEQCAVLCGIPGTTRKVEGDILLYREGEDIDSVSCLCSGRVVILKKGEDGEEHVVGTAVPGDLLGYPDIMINAHHLNSALMVEKCTLFVIPRETFIELTKQNPAVLLRLMARLDRRLTAAEDRIVSLGGTASERNGRNRMNGSAE